jgi:hypothetical protein
MAVLRVHVVLRWPQIDDAHPGLASEPRAEAQRRPFDLRKLKADATG